MKDRYFNFFLFLLGSFLWLFVFLIPFYFVEKDQSGVTYYGYPINLNGDYYHYTYFLKSGLEGRLNFDNVYTDSAQPLQFLEPHYNLVGLLMRPTGLNAPELFTLLRILTPLIMMGSLIWLVIKMTKSRLIQVGSVLVSIFSTSFWWFGMQDPDVYSPMFRIWQKILILPPHYFVSTALTIAILILSVQLNKSWKATMLILFLMLNLSVMHPYISVMSYGYLVFVFLLELIMTRKFIKNYFLRLCLIGLSIVPIIYYYQYMLSFYWGSVNLANVAVKNLPIQQYLLSLGPVFILSLPALLYRKSWHNPYLVRIMIWGFLPIGYFLSNLIGVPFSISRIYQSYQHIPLSLLAMISSYRLFEIFLRKFKNFCLILTIGLIVLYGIRPLYFDIQYLTQELLPYHHWMNEIVSAKGIINYFNNITSKNIVVLAPNTISAFLPSFTSAKVFIGIEGCNPNYYKNLALTEKFYRGEMNKAEILDFINKFKIQYIVFGISNVSFRELSYAQSPLFKILYEDNFFSIVEPNL